MHSLESNSRFARSVAMVFAALLGSGLGILGTLDAQAKRIGGSVIVSTFVDHGLNNPRGLKFGPDGYLYVAEGGYPSDPLIGAPTGKGNNCSTGSGGPGEYFGSTTGSRISRVDTSGNVTTFVDNLPSSEAGAVPPSVDGGLASGVADIAFVGNTMYAIYAGAGCSHGVPGIPNQVIRINPDGTKTMIADLSAFQQANPVTNPTDAIRGSSELRCVTQV